MQLNWYANIGQGQGYSGSSEQTALALDRREDTDVTLMGYKLGAAHERNLTKAGKKLAAKEFRLADVGVAHGFPNSFSSILNRFKVGYTMFETDTLPAGHNRWTGNFAHASQAINEQLDLLLTPAEWDVRMFRDNGVRIPIEVVPNGVNPKHFSFIQRPIDRPFTFLMLGTLTLRKNPGAVIAAFAELFGKNPDVKLVLKTQSGTLGHMDFAPSMGNIKIIDRLSTLAELQQLYADADCFVFPSRGEGFGMPPIEAMATGLPTIFSNHSGMMDYANPAFNYPINLSHKTPAQRFPKDWGYVGNWYEPDQEHLKQLMLEVYESRAASLEKGALAAKYVAENFNYDVVAEKTVSAIKKHYTE